jgi:hypothetical protein
VDSSRQGQGLAQVAEADLDGDLLVEWANNQDGWIGGLCC